MRPLARGLSLRYAAAPGSGGFAAVPWALKRFESLKILADGTWGVAVVSGSGLTMARS